MSRYIQFLFAGIFRKKSIYLCGVIFALLSSTFIYLGISQANDENVSGIKSISGFTAWMPFVISTIFNSIIVIHCFKSGENDGTDLIISSKPITRMRQIISKFIVVWLMSLIFGVFCFLSMIPICLVDEYATNEQIFRFTGSITIGLVIIGFIIISITIMVSSITSKMGTLIISLLLSAVPPILSFSVIPSANAENYLEETNDYAKDANSSFRLLKEIKVDNATDIYAKPQKSNFGQPIFKYANSKGTKENHDSWYKYVAYGDLWYQWNGLFSLTTKGKGKKFGYDVSYIGLKKIGTFNDVISDKSNIQHSNIGMYLAFTNYEYNLLFAKSQDVSKEKINALAHNLKSVNILRWIGSSNLTDKIGEALLQIGISSNPKNDLKIDQIKNIQNAWISFKIAKYIRKLLDDPTQKYSLTHKDDLLYTINYILRNNKFIKSENLLVNILNEGQASFDPDKLILHKYERQDFINKNIVIIIWSIIAIVLVGLSILIYVKRDFK